jgi:glycosyltransferase involved in cell wall biosynthesis
MHVHQFHPTVAYGDAVGNQILSIQRLAGRIGYWSEVFCERSPIHFEGQARQLVEYERWSAPDNVLLLHYSLTYSAHVMDWLSRLPDRKVLVYHNITPYQYFAGVNEVYMESARKGREQLDQLLTVAGTAWGVSSYNRQELAARGWTKLGVLPIIFDPTRYAARPDRRVRKQCEGGLNVLFVGRISPNKRIEDLILTFYYLKQSVRPDARLFVVGSAQGMGRYLAFLEALVGRLGLLDVIFTGHVSTSQLVAYYQSADVYLSMSEHEGFGVPLLESMYFEVPVVAYKAAAVPETLGDAGMLVTAKDYRALAELVGLLREDDQLRTRIVEQQSERLEAFLPETVEGHLRELLERLDP